VDVVVLEEAPANSDFASDLFISEYIEGTPGNRKAIEIYNGTGADVTLDGVYTLKLNTNANTTWGSAIALTGTIAAGDVFVVYYDDSTNNDMLGTFGDFESTAIAFNGDDAIGLFKNDVLIDIFGVFGEDPGDGWTVSTIANATKDGIITRNPGATGPSAVWDPSEWTRVAAYVDGTVTTLGSHTN
jgi:predicted extracellular nuclease